MNSVAILLAEDDENDVIFVRHAFKQAQIYNTMSVVETGEEVINYLRGTGRFADRSHYPIPGLILMDINIPLRGGLELLQWIRAQPELRHIVVILWTSTAQPKVVSDAYRLGANSFLFKPATPAELASLAKAIKEYWLDRNRFPPEDALREES